MTAQLNVAAFLIIFVLCWVIIGCLTSCALIWVDTRRWSGGVPEWMILGSPLVWPLVWLCCAGFAALWASLSVLFWLVDWYGRRYD